MTDHDDDVELLAEARDGDEHAFEQLVSRYRRELRAHCYRLLGSLQDAEDATQESLLAAWRGLGSFEGRSSFRTWLYRISTNACLRISSRRPQRILSPDHGPPRRDTADLGQPVAGPIWLEPWPDDDVLTGLASAEPGPAASVIQRESIELAFVAALQHLSSIQRAVLILREVLQFSAAETAEMLDTTPVSVNSALQRARATMELRRPRITQRAELAALGEPGLHELLTSLVAAWERADVGGVAALLAQDVRFTMPPLPAWFDGREDVVRFLKERVFQTPWRLVLIWINAQPAIACYQQQASGTGPFRLGAVNVLTVRDGMISQLSGFLDPALHRWYGLAEEISSGVR